MSTALKHEFPATNGVPELNEFDAHSTACLPAPQAFVTLESTSTCSEHVEPPATRIATVAVWAWHANFPTTCVLVAVVDPVVEPVDVSLDVPDVETVVVALVVAVEVAELVPVDSINEIAQGFGRWCKKRVVSVVLVHCLSWSQMQVCLVFWKASAADSSGRRACI